MPNIFAKAIALAVIAGGFALTGDLGWIASRGMRLLDAADVAAPSLTDRQEPVRPAAASPEPAAARPVPVPAPALGPRPQPIVLVDAEVQPPAGGCEHVAWTALSPGDRVVVWFATRGQRCLVLDVVDPATGEALAYEVAAVSKDGQPLASAAPPRRVIVGRPADGPAAVAISKGGMLHVAPAGIAAAGNEGRWLGPVEALDLVR